MKEVRSFLGHIGFYRRFIQDFSKIARPLCKLLAKETPFVFDEDCQKAFGALKKILTSITIIQPPNWGIPFEIMCDVSDYAVGAVLGQRIDRLSHVIYYASRTLERYTTQLFCHIEGVIGSHFCFGQVSIISARIQSHYLLGSCGIEVSFLQKRY